ncbi:hypothetical protein P775_05735 [Puniceibacterium antarcticum]|uniref:non-specific protein-tyrosine kinase n=1 Tax=Puniceibacterium antarcticum TaxID=1206336 RepID=A0A2G8RI46_9RHOB|nr:polysaccharide biosynthesis tyrosine autokinase [Puniceibacterium antarcticum]PIL21182.1 hypothetical protein P775_05735 [Puniceibacterium antarcticum]
MNETHSPPSRRTNSEKVSYRSLPGNASVGASDDGVIDLGAVFGTLWRGKLLILATTLLAILIGGYYAYFVATPLYRSTAVVMLNNREEQVIDFQSVIGGLGSDASVVNTEVEVIQSRSLLGKVVDQLNLMEDPEFNESLRPPSAIENLQQVAKGIFNLENPAIEGADQGIRQATISRLLGVMSVRNVPQSLVFQITIETTDPEKSASIADALVDLYILNQLEVKFDATEQATTWLTERVTDLQAQLEQAEAKVRDFQANTDLVDQASLEAQDRQIKDIRDRIETTRVTKENADQRLVAIREADTPQAQAEVSGDPQLQRFLASIDTPETYQAFQDRYAQVMNRAEIEVQRAQNQLDALNTSRVALENQIARQSSDLIALQQLTREAEASRMLYEYFLARLKETSAQQGVQQADSRILSDAVIPNNESAPRKSLILAISGILGLMFGVALVLLREAGQDRFRTSSSVEAMTGYAVMGQVPLLPSKRRKDTINYLAEKPTSAAAEAIRNFRTSALLSNVDNPPQIIAISSSIPGEGKTTLSLSLAQNLSAMGKKVLLIEGDMRRRVVSTYLNEENKSSKGIISVMTGAQTLTDTVVHDNNLGADILLGEKGSANAADIFTSERFKAMLDEARVTYDYIVIDTPPVLVVPDARIIAQMADALVLVVKWDSTSRTQVIEALKMFESVNHPVSGVVLNQISPKGMKRYGYGEKYGAYGSYGRKYYMN